MYCKQKFRHEFHLTSEVSMSVHDEAWREASLVAAGLGFPKDRWHSESTEGMAKEMYEEAVREAARFSRWIDEYPQ